MYSVTDFDFGRVSWYYEDVATDPTPADMSRFRYTPADLAARWVVRRGGWPTGSRVIGQDWTAAGLPARLTSCGVVVQGLGAGIGPGGAAGAFVLAPAETIWDQVVTGALDHAFDALAPASPLLVAMEFDFVSNRGFDALAEALEQERQWLSLPADEFARSVPGLRCDLAVRSPSLLARLLCARLGVAAEPSFAHRGVDHFVFDPDVLVTPLGARIDSQTQAQRIAAGQGGDAARRGIALVALARTCG